jgi:hypothetical protein
MGLWMTMHCLHLDHNALLIQCAVGAVAAAVQLVLWLVHATVMDRADGTV